jgi:hypothetical protein
MGHLPEHHQLYRGWECGRGQEGFRSHPTQAAVLWVLARFTRCKPVSATPQRTCTEVFSAKQPVD